MHAMNSIIWVLITWIQWRHYIMFIVSNSHQTQTWKWMRREHDWKKTIRIWDANSWWFQSFIGEWNQWEHWIAYEIREWRWTRIMLTSQPHWMVWITMRSNMHGTGWTLIAMFSLQSMINSMRAGWLNHDEDVDYEFRSSWWFQCERHDNIDSMLVNLTGSLIIGAYYLLSNHECILFTLWTH